MGFRNTELIPQTSWAYYEISRDIEVTKVVLCAYLHLFSCHLKWVLGIFRLDLCDTTSSVTSSLTLYIIHYIGHLLNCRKSSFNNKYQVITHVVSVIYIFERITTKKINIKATSLFNLTYLRFCVFVVYKPPVFSLRILQREWFLSF